jgi:hypothetical protein
MRGGRGAILLSRVGLSLILMAAVIWTPMRVPASAFAFSNFLRCNLAISPTLRVRAVSHVDVLCDSRPVVGLATGGPQVDKPDVSGHGFPACLASSSTLQNRQIIRPALLLIPPLRC